MAERSLTAAFLLSMIVVASADRALLNKPSGGALHGVAFTASYYAATTSGTDVTPANYFITNGNGSWTYSPYSTATNAAYASINSAFGAAGLAVGTSAVLPSDTTILPSAYGNFAIGINDIVFPSKNLGVAVGAALSDTIETPTILITLDGALTWMSVTGVPTITVGAETVGSATAWPKLAAGPPDLTSVFFASKSLGWAAGGLIGAGASNPYSAGAVTPLGATSTPATTSAGTILMTTNGGTVWTNVPVNPPAASLNTAPTAGVLTSIMSDSAGKNVYAVGAPGTVFTNPGNPWTLANAATIEATPLTYGTILYSANSGASWVTQTAPAVAGWTYGFMSVYVQKGTTAWAVGGNIADPTGSSGLSAGVIVATFNGGFSWSLMSYPGVASGKAPTFTTIAYNGKTAWVGGYIYDDFYPSKPSGAAVSSSNANILVNAGNRYTLLSSADGKQFNAVAPSSLPAGFVATGSDTSSAPATTNNVFGITWDNANRGFIYGTGFIMSTQNGGSTWVYETPNFLATATPAGLANVVVGLANVPTTY